MTWPLFISKVQPCPTSSVPIYRPSAYHSGVMVYALWAGSSSTVPRSGTKATVSEPECCVHAHECAWCMVCVCVWCVGVCGGIGACV